MIDAAYSSNQRNSIPVDCELVDQCPHCAGKITPHIAHKYFIHNQNNPVPEVVVYLLQCPSKDCHEFFTSTYDVKNQTSISPFQHDGVLREYNYFPQISANISENIRNLSEEFSITYTHALRALDKGLYSIVGVSLRKAFEFLIKDFAIYRNPEDINTVKRKSMNEIIQEYFKDMPSLETLAHIIRRIGNDETHYYRKYTDIDVNDLLELIENFSLYMGLILNTEKFTNRMERN